MIEPTDWRAKLLDDGGLFSEKEPDDIYAMGDEDFDDGKGLGYWEGLRFHVVCFRDDGSFLQFHEDASNNGETYDLREGTYVLEGDQLRLTYLERHEWSSTKWGEPPVRRSSGPFREQRTVQLHAAPGEATFELPEAKFHPIAECPAAEASREFLAESLETCRRRAGRLVHPV